MELHAKDQNIYNALTCYKTQNKHSLDNFLFKNLSTRLFPKKSFESILIHYAAVKIQKIQKFRKAARIEF